MGYEKKVTIILPSLNVAGYIRTTLESVCRQTLNEIEILCIDAGSTDGTIEIIKEYAQKDQRIQLLISEKKSYGFQVNLGIKLAKGEYIAVLETDDYIEPIMYEHLYSKAKTYNLDYIKADYKAFFTQENGDFFFLPRHTFSDRNLYDSVILPIDHPNIGSDDWYLWQGIYSVSFLKKNGIFLSESPGAAFQDIGFLFWTNIFACRVMYCSELMYNYRIDRIEASSNSGKGLKYSYAEFSSILTELDNRKINDSKVSYLLLSRMIKSFSSSCKELAFSACDDIDFEDKFGWFCEVIRKAYDNNLIDPDTLESTRWNKVYDIVISNGKNLQENKYHALNRFTEGTDEFAIFGCGDYGYRVYSLIKHFKKKVVRYYDNNVTLWGKELNSILIEEPAKIVQLNSNIKIIIANENHSAEILKQITDYGIATERIFVFE